MCRAQGLVESRPWAVRALQTVLNAIAGWFRDDRRGLTQIAVAARGIVQRAGGRACAGGRAGANPALARMAGITLRRLGDLDRYE